MITFTEEDLMTEFSLLSSLPITGIALPIPSGGACSVLSVICLFDGKFSTPDYDPRTLQSR